MAGKKKDFRQCANCGRGNQADKDVVNGFTYRVSGSNRHSMSCPCGMMTKQFETKERLKACWHSRPGKLVEVPVITVAKMKLSKAKHDDLQEEEF
jgi:hypothetical protein